MTANIKIKAQAPVDPDQICNDRINYAKIKNEAGDCSQPVSNEHSAPSSASIDQSEALSRADGNKVHSINSDEETCTPEPLVRKEGAIMTSEEWKALGFSFEASPSQTLQIDTAKYQALLDDSGLSDDQKEEIILELWKIIIPFVDLGFKVSPLDLACGKLAQSTDHTGNQDSAMVKSDKPNLSETFNQFAAQ
jgi:hypothetical protein